MAGFPNNNPNPPGPNANGGPPLIRRDMGVGIAPPFPRQPGYNADPADGILGQYDALANKADTQVVYNYARELANLQANNNEGRPKLQTLKGLAGNPVGNGQNLEYHKALTRAFEAAVDEMRDQRGGRRRRTTRTTRKGRKGRRSTRRRGGGEVIGKKAEVEKARIAKENAAFAAGLETLEDENVAKAKRAQAAAIKEKAVGIGALPPKKGGRSTKSRRR